MKKTLALILAIAMMAALLAACGEDKPAATETTAAATEAPASTKSFQFTGVYSEEGEFASMLAAAFLLNLNEDGTASCDKYAFGQYNADPAASNPS